MKHIRKFLTAAAALLLLMAAFALKPFSPAEAATNKVLITQTFKVTSAVQGTGLLQKYKTTITGQIKNDTDTAYQDIVITLNVKTSTLGVTGQLLVNIATLNAGQTYAINEVQDTTENFEAVTSYSATASGATLTLSLPSSNTGSNSSGNTGGNSGGGGGLSDGAIAGIVIGVVAVGVLIFILNRIYKRREAERKAKEEREKIAAGYRRVRHGKGSRWEYFGNPAGNAATPPPANTPIIVNVTAPAHAPAPAAAPKVLMRCPYCSTKNDATDGKCSGCGAQL